MSELEESESDSESDDDDNGDHRHSSNNEDSPQSSPVRGKAKQTSSRRNMAVVSDSEDQSPDRKLKGQKTKLSTSHSRKPSRQQSSSSQSRV